MSPLSVMLTVMTGPHRHPVPEFPAVYSHSGEPLNLSHALTLVGAMYDDCAACQSFHTADVLNGPPEVISFMASIAYASIRTTLRAIAGKLGAEQAGVGSLGLFSAETRSVFSALDREDPLAAEALVRDMSREQRAHVLGDVVVDLVNLVGGTRVRSAVSGGPGGTAVGPAPREPGS